MRTSRDEYKLSDGSIVAVSQDVMPPKGAILWNGYDYAHQYWVFEGEKDIRTLEQLKASVSMK